MSTENNQEYLQTMFEYAPISLWEQDFSGIKKAFDDLRANGVNSLTEYLAGQPDFIEECMGKIKVLNVNLQTLSLFKAASKEYMLANLSKVFRDGMRHHFRSELFALWEGEVNWSGEGVNYTFEGDPIDILLDWRILPGYEKNWNRVLVTIENITGRRDNIQIA